MSGINQKEIERVALNLNVDSGFTSITTMPIRTHYPTALKIVNEVINRRGVSIDVAMKSLIRNSKNVKIILEKALKLKDEYFLSADMLDKIDERQYELIANLI